MIEISFQEAAPQHWLDVLNSGGQILFWLVAGTVAVLTFRQAKRTIFQPAKNEVFKVQVEKLQQLMTDLDWRSQREADRCSGLEEAFVLTTRHFFDSFAIQEFGEFLQLESGTEIEKMGALRNPNAGGFELIRGPADECESEPRPRRKVDWAAFEWELLYFGPRYVETRVALDGYLSNPILPEAVLSVLRDLDAEVFSSFQRCAEDVQRVVRELPRHYPDEAAFAYPNFDWANNARKERGQRLAQAHENLRSAIRAYLRTDELFEAKN